MNPSPGLNASTLCRDIKWENQVCEWFAHAPRCHKLALAQYKQQATGETLLFAAARLNSVAIANLLHEADAEIDLPSPAEGGATPLMEAVCYRSYGMVKWLLDRGADRKKVMPGTNGRTLQGWVIANFSRSDVRLTNLFEFNGVKPSLKDRS